MLPQLLPPPVDAHIGGPCEPGVQDVDAAQSVCFPDGVPQGRVVVQPQSLPEPVDGVDHHVACLLYLSPVGSESGEGVSRKQQQQQQQKDAPYVFW